MKQSSSWEINNYSGNQESPPPFMEPEGSLPYSHGLANWPYFQPHESNLNITTYFFNMHFNIILTYTWASHLVFSLQVFRPKFFMNFSPLPHVINAPPVFFPWFHHHLLLVAVIFRYIQVSLTSTKSLSVTTITKRKRLIPQSITWN
jgi:hypothetical protein